MHNPSYTHVHLNIHPYINDQDTCNTLYNKVNANQTFSNNKWHLK